MAARSDILGLGSRLHPGNMQRILNKDLTRFHAESFSRTPKSSKQKKGSSSRVLWGRLNVKFKPLFLSHACEFKKNYMPHSITMGSLVELENKIKKSV